MTNTIWSNPVSGNWNNAADWSAGVPTPGTDAILNAAGSYTITISSANQAGSLFVDAPGAMVSEDSGGSLALTGGLTLDAGAVILSGANNFGGPSRLVSGMLELGNSAALGTPPLTIDSGTVLGIANETIANNIVTDGSFALAAARGDKVNLAGNVILDMNGGGTIDFGEKGDSGTLFWAPLTLGIADTGPGFSVNVNAGTLRDGDGSLGQLLGIATSTMVEQYGKIDLHGYAETIANLGGSGTITSNKTGGALTIDEGNFAGAITGSLSLAIVGSVTLSGSNTYTGGTTIGKDAQLFLTYSGSVEGAIVDKGILSESSGTIANEISGTGSVNVYGDTTISNAANSYRGGTTIYGATLDVSDAALGTGQLTFSNGTLVGTSTVSFDNKILVEGNGVIAAASGTTLTINPDVHWTAGSNASFGFGTSSDDGVVVWASSSGSAPFGGAHSIAIYDGTLRAGSSDFQTLLDVVHGKLGGTYIAPTGTLDSAGFAETIIDLQGTGTIENSGASAVLTIAGGNFSGDFSGPIVLDVGGNTALGGDAANWNTINLDSGAELKIVTASSANIDFSSASSAELFFDDPAQFTGSITGFGNPGDLVFPTATKVSVSYSGDTSGGTLTVSSSSFAPMHINMVGNYTDGTFEAIPSSRGFGAYVIFDPNSPAAATTRYTDAFDFSTAGTPHTAPEAAISRLHGGNGASNVAFADDVTEATNAHGFAFEHFMHDLFVHHAMPEALA